MENNTHPHNYVISNNIKSKKANHNNDEIVWELKRKNSISFALLWSIAFRVGIIFFGIYICYLVSDSLLLVSLVFILLVAYNASLLVMTFNIKSMFITSKNLILQKYIGRDLILPLGEFYCDDESEVVLRFDSIIAIRPIFGNKILPYYLFLDCLNTNIDEIFDVLREPIESYLINSNEADYKRFRNIYRGFVKNYIDFNKIDKLREEQSND